MLNIRTKTESEIKEEEGLYSFAASVAKGSTKKVCTTYMVKADGTKVDTFELTEVDLIKLIIKDVRTQTQGISTFKLIETLKKSFEISPGGAVKLLEVQDTYGHIIADIMGSAGYNRYLDLAHNIGYYIKQSKGDYSQLTREEIKSILMQMQRNIDGRKK